MFVIAKQTLRDKENIEVFPTHNPTHSESCLVGFPRILAVPAVL